MSITALIFDFDGLILDTESPEYVSWREIYTEFGCDLPLELWADAIGRGHDQVSFNPYEFLQTRTDNEIDSPRLLARRKARWLALVELEPVRPGVAEYLNAARGMGLELAVASSSSRDWVEGHLHRLGLREFFALTRCSDDVTRTKPAPDLYLSALEGLGVGAESAIAFEDSPNGVQAARAAALYCVAVPNAITAPLDLSQASRRISSMAGIPLKEVLDAAAKANGLVG